MNLYFHDKKLDKYHFLLSVDNKLNRWKLTRELRTQIERVTEWDFNKGIFGDSQVTLLMFNGEADYGKRGVIYDIHHESNKEVAREIKLKDLLYITSSNI